MSGFVLFDQCIQIVQESALSEGWPLPPQAIQAFTRDVCALYPPDAAPTPDEIRRVVSNYYLDCPAVREMLSQGSRAGEQLWDAWCKQFVKWGQGQHLTVQDAEDLGEIVYWQAAKALETFQFRCRLSTYLKAVFTRCYCRFWQQITRHPQEPWPASGGEETDEQDRVADIVDRSLSPPEIVEARDLSRVLWAAVREECETVRRSVDFQILVWYYVDETYVDEATGVVKRWTDQAIGDHLAMPLNTVTSRRHRLLERLQRNPRLLEFLRERAHNQAI